mmetsp:Transcript_153241/g.278538  ORF Transcript_153241/g.278538 Transcript_153241/m.278538 type:complete len:229 (+) Transcript_153241:580-1266(+)
MGWQRKNLWALRAWVLLRAGIHNADFIRGDGIEPNISSLGIRIHVERDSLLSAWTQVAKSIKRPPLACTFSQRGTQAAKHALAFTSLESLVLGILQYKPDVTQAILCHCMQVTNILCQRDVIGQRYFPFLQHFEVREGPYSDGILSLDTNNQRVWVLLRDEDCMRMFPIDPLDSVVRDTKPITLQILVRLPQMRLILHVFSCYSVQGADPFHFDNGSRHKRREQNRKL